MTKLLKLLTILVVLLALPALAAACPTCKDGMGNDPNGANMISGYFWSIIFMMSMPYLIFTSLGLYLYWEVRKARRAKALAAAANVAVSAAPVVNEESEALAETA